MPLTKEQVDTGLSEARRIINQSAGYYFGGELTTFAPEFKSLALRAIDQLREERDRAVANGLTRNDLTGCLGVLTANNDFGRHGELLAKLRVLVLLGGAA